MAGWCLAMNQPKSEYLALTRDEREAFIRVYNRRQRQALTS